MKRTRKDTLLAQAAAADFILWGFKPAEVAAMLGVHRGTVWRWSRYPAYRTAYTLGQRIPSIARYYRLVKRDPTILARLGSDNPYTSGAAARKVLRAVGMKDVLAATFCDPPGGSEREDNE